MRGKVTRIVSLKCAVDCEQGVFECAARRRLIDRDTGQSKPVAVGDDVEFDVTAPHQGVIRQLLPRRTHLSRARVRGQREDRRVEHVIVANVDQLLIVGSVREPPLSVGFIDRCIIAGQSGGLSPVVCINKSDLAETPGEYGPVQDLYLQSGLPVVLTSARTGEGIGGLRDLLAGRSTVLAGHSGVGKSSLLNALQPGLRLKIGEMGQWKGTHCTTTVSLLKLDRGGYVVDTPGIREFSLWEIGPGDVAQFFSRIWELGAHCRMSDCTHTHEPHCAVKDALESGRLPALSYDSYVSIVSSIQQDGVPRETGVDRPADQIRKEKRGGSRSTRKQRMMETWREDLGEQPGEEADAQ